MGVLTRIPSALLICILAGCGSHGRAPVEDRYAGAASMVKEYRVQRGDTLYSIAFRYGLDYRKVAEVNSIAAPYTIYPGQKLYLWQVTPSPVVVTPPTGGAGLPDPAAPGGVVVTAVPGVAAAPDSGVAAPPSPVYQNGKPPVATRMYRQNGVATPPVEAPAIATPPIGATAQSAGTSPLPAAAATPSPEVAAVAQPRPPDAAAPAAPAAARPAPPPARPPAPGARVETWRWPTGGAVTRGFSPSVHKGIDIGGNRGDPVYAVADGVVVYAGTGIVGFGELLIVKHNDIYISAYGHNDRLLVRENEVVRAGQAIAEKGSTGTDTVKLHFEIRREGRPVDPLTLLPAR